MRTKGIIIGIIAAVILGGGAAFLQIQSTARQTEEIGEVLADKNELGITVRTKAPTVNNPAAYSELAMSEESRLLYPELAGEIDAFTRKIREMAEQNSSGVYVSIYRADPGMLSCTVASNADENANTWYWNVDPGTGRPVSLFSDNVSPSYVLEDDGIFLSRVSDHLMSPGI